MFSGKTEKEPAFYIAKDSILWEDVFTTIPQVAVNLPIPVIHQARYRYQSLRRSAATQTKTCASCSIFFHQSDPDFLYIEHASTIDRYLLYIISLQAQPTKYHGLAVLAKYVWWWHSNLDIQASSHITEWNGFLGWKRSDWKARPKPRFSARSHERKKVFFQHPTALRLGERSFHLRSWNLATSRNQELIEVASRIQQAIWTPDIPLLSSVYVWETLQYRRLILTIYACTVVYYAGPWPRVMTAMMKSLCHGAWSWYAGQIEAQLYAFRLLHHKISCLLSLSLPLLRSLLRYLHLHALETTGIMLDSCWKPTFIDLAYIQSCLIDAMSPVPD